MEENWAEKFTKKLQDKELASQEAKKSFQIYKDSAVKLFDDIEAKVKNIREISIVRTVVGHSAPTPGPIKALNLKCPPKVLKFVPEGINLDESRGRIRIEHNCRNIPQFIYIHLIIDPASTAAFPDNLVWKYNCNDKCTDYTQLPNFGEAQLEELIETCFLE